MTQEEVVQFWKESSNRDWEFSQEVFAGGKRYDSALFFVHLSLEKLLKAVHYHLKNEHPLAIHDLVVLAKKTGMAMDQNLESRLKEITSFNIAARYDDYKLSFYKKATKEYTSKWIENAKEVRDSCLGILS